MRINKLIKQLFFLTFLCSFFSSCSDHDDTSKIRIAHLMAEVDEVDLLENGDTLFSRINYAEVSDYNSVGDDSSEFEVIQSDSFTSLGIIRRSLAVDEDYTLFVFGDDKDSSLSLVLDDNSSPSSGKSRLRFVQAATTESGVDVYITKASELIANAIPSFENRRFKSISNYVESESGDYRIRVTKSNSPVVLVDSGIVSFSSGSVSTIILTDKKEDRGLPDLLIANDKDDN